MAKVPVKGGLRFFEKLGITKLMRIARTKFGKAWRQGRKLSRNVAFETKQLQAKFKKHAKDFGVTGNWNKEAAAKFQKALQNHLDDPATKARSGTYNGIPVTHFYNPKTGVNLMRTADGKFLSGWKLTPAQTMHLLKTGKIGGN